MSFRCKGTRWVWREELAGGVPATFLFEAAEESILAKIAYLALLGQDLTLGYLQSGIASHWDEVHHDDECNLTRK
jgi:hypothetical protein